MVVMEASQVVKNLPSGKGSTGQCGRHRRCGFEAWVWKTALEEEMATHSRILDRRIPWAERPGGLQSTGPQRAGRDRARTPEDGGPAGRVQVGS